MEICWLDRNRLVKSSRQIDGERGRRRIEIDGEGGERGRPGLIPAPGSAVVILRYNRTQKKVILIFSI